MHRLIHGDCVRVLPKLPYADCIFADPFDNIGLAYEGYSDSLPTKQYVDFLRNLLERCCAGADSVWISFNSRWIAEVGSIVVQLRDKWSNLEFKPCVQVFTFGQHRHSDLGNNHRPLWRLKWKNAPLFPEQIKVASWRQRNGDPRAAPGGRVPGDVFDYQYPSLGDVFDFPRVTGNSKQRCDWHPTQLHEDLVERCIKLTTREGDRVIDPFGGTGTTLRVCKRINRECILIESSEEYCRKLSELHGLPVEKFDASSGTIISEPASSS